MDPANAKSAKDVMDEMEESARKRKREDEGELSEIEGIPLEHSKEGLKTKKGRDKKGQKIGNQQEDYHESSKAGETEATNVRVLKAEKRRIRRERKKAKEQSQAAKREAKRARRKQEKAAVEDDDANPRIHLDEAKSDDETTNELEMNPIEIDDQAGNNSPVESAATSLSKAHSPIFDVPSTQSGTSSISSIAAPNASSEVSKGAPPEPPTDAPSEPSKDESSQVPNKPDPEQLRARLQQRIEFLRAARKADKEDGTAAPNREELIESRRKKSEQRKAHKKKLRQQAKEEEQREKALALSRGSPLLSPSGMSPAGPHGQSPLSEPGNNFSYGRISFKDGHTMTANLDSMLNPHKAKGPQDAHTALEAANKRIERLSALDPAKRADIEEKDMWLNARKRAHGERIRDDTSLLKKTLKRKEKQKRKSEKEWSERLQGQAKGQAARQKKREDNLQKRREEKGSKGKKKGKAAAKKKARPGFEGSFRAGGKR